MLNIVFTPNAETISDFEIYSFVDELIYNDFVYSKDEYTIAISTHLVIDEIRARIKQNELNRDYIAIYVCRYLLDDEIIYKPIDKDGRSEIWTLAETILDRILDRLI